MSKIVLLDKGDYYTQRNNLWDDPNTPEHDKWSACMPTARVMWLKANRIPYTNPMPQKWADDDYFMALLNTKEAKKYRDQCFSWAGNTPPNQIHGMYPEYLDRIVCGKQVSIIREDINFEAILKGLEAGKAYMCSGWFMGQNGKIPGHAVVIVGVNEAQELLLADPYGDYRTSYASDKGYLVPMGRNDFIEHIKPAGKLNKLAHVRID